MLAPPPAPLIELRDVWYRYADQPPALRGIDLSILPGRWLAILGCNGSGKTTLVKHFNGLLRPWQGKVLLEGQDTAGRSIGELAQKIGYLPQHPDRLLFAATIHDEIAFGLRQRHCEKEEIEARVHQVLTRLDLHQATDVPPAVQGYGVRRKISLAAILALQPQLLVLDEPTNGLDAGSITAFLNAVQEFRRLGATIVMVTHDLDWVARYASDVILMSEGQILAAGPVRQILSDAALMQSAGLPLLPISRLYHLWALRSGEQWPMAPLTPQEFADGWFAAAHTDGPR